jgi:serine protease
VRYASGLSNDSGTILSEAQKADVLNLSLGCNNCYSSAEEAEYVAARAAGSIIIAAAGNENTASLGYPASYDGVVSVSALDRFKQRAPYSNFGTRIDVAAPGGDNSVDADGDGYADGVLSTAGDDSSGTRQATYKFENGTSMASPHMAGVVALMKSANPSFITPDQLDTLLSSGAITEDVAGNGATVRDDIYGYGMIDALKAVQAAQGGVTPTTLAVAPTSLSFASAVSSQTLTLSAQGGGTVVVNSVTPSAAWLSATGTGLGDYTVSVDRTGFGDGTYPANLIVNYTINGTTSEINVPVTMTVGTATTGAGDTGYTWMVLLDPDTNTTVQTQRAANNNGQYAFTFTGIADGSYYVVAGSDSDNDFILCDAGESCGGYPTLGQLQQITVSGGDVTGINFISLFDVNFGTAAASAQQEEFSGFSRQPAAQKEME